MFGGTLNLAQSQFRSSLYIKVIGSKTQEQKSTSHTATFLSFYDRYGAVCHCKFISVTHSTIVPVHSHEHHCAASRQQMQTSNCWSAASHCQVRHVRKTRICDCHIRVPHCHQCGSVCLLQLGHLTVLLRHLEHNWKHCFLFDCLIMCMVTVELLPLSALVALRPVSYTHLTLPTILRV